MNDLIMTLDIISDLENTYEKLKGDLRLNTITAERLSETYVHDQIIQPMKALAEKYEEIEKRRHSRTEVISAMNAAQKAPKPDVDKAEADYETAQAIRRHQQHEIEKKNDFIEKDRAKHSALLAQRTKEIELTKWQLDHRGLLAPASGIVNIYGAQDFYVGRGDLLFEVLE